METVSVHRLLRGGTLASARDVTVNDAMRQWNSTDSSYQHDCLLSEATNDVRVVQHFVQHSAMMDQI